MTVSWSYFSNTIVNTPRSVSPPPTTNLKTISENIHDTLVELLLSEQTQYASVAYNSTSGALHDSLKFDQSLGNITELSKYIEEIYYRLELNGNLDKYCDKLYPLISERLYWTCPTEKIFFLPEIKEIIYISSDIEPGVLSCVHKVEHMIHRWLFVIYIIVLYNKFGYTFRDSQYMESLEWKWGAR